MTEKCNCEQAIELQELVEKLQICGTCKYFKRGIYCYCKKQLHEKETRLKNSCYDWEIYEE